MNTSRPPLKSVWARFWEALGDGRRLYEDEYLWAAVVFALVSCPLWITPLWWDTTINVLSILIGFSVCGMSVALNLADRLGNRLLRRSTYDGSSPLVTLVAGYVQYLVVGIGALGASVLCKSWYQPKWLEAGGTEWEFVGDVLYLIARALWLIVGFLFCYSLTSALRFAMAIFRLTTTVQHVEDVAPKKGVNIANVPLAVKADPGSTGNPGEN